LAAKYSVAGPSRLAAKPDLDLVIARHFYARSLLAGLLLLFSALTGWPGAYAEDPASTILRLVGGVSHSDRLDPLPADERVGAVVPSVAAAPATRAISPNVRLPAKQVVAPTFTQPSQSRNLQPQLQPQSALTQAQPRRAASAGHYYQPVPPAQLNAGASQSQQSPQYQQFQQGQQSPQASLQMLKQLNAHVNTRGSPMAPKLQVLAPSQTSQAQFHAGAARLDTMAVYQKNLQAIASMNLQHTAPGQTWQAKLQASGPSVKVEVPFWLAGVWSRAETSESSRIELPSGKALKAVGKQKAAVTDTFGTVKDKSGKVWMVVPLHNRGAVDRGFAIDRHQVNKYELILTGKTSALVKVEASHSVIDKRTNRVIQAYQDEEFNEYSLVKDGLVKTDSSVKVFDQNGNAKLLTRAVSTEKRVRKL